MVVHFVRAVVIWFHLVLMLLIVLDVNRPFAQGYTRILVFAIEIRGGYHYSCIFLGTSSTACITFVFVLHLEVYIIPLVFA